jgi:hypothetical protein
LKGGFIGMLLIGLGLAVAAQASQVGYRPISLQNLSTSSVAIVKVTVADPAYTLVDVKIAPASDKGCAPYAMQRFHFEVVEVVHLREGTKAPTGTIEVWWAHGRALARISEKACVEGVHRSPIFSVYNESTGKLTAGREVLVFLDRHDDWGWELAARGAWEEPSAETRILEFVAR